MKKITGIIAMILFLAPNAIRADEIFDIKWSLVNSGFGMNSYQTQAHEDYPGESWELYFALGTIAVEHINSRIGFEFNPARWWADEISLSSERRGWNFLNLNLYWNMVAYKLFQFGPFNRINYMYLTDEGIDWSKITNTVGIRLQLASYFDHDSDSYDTLQAIHYIFRYIGVECGYRIKDGRNTFYWGVDVDIIGPLYVLYGVGEIVFPILGFLFGG